MVVCTRNISKSGKPVKSLLAFVFIIFSISAAAQSEQYREAKGALEQYLAFYNDEKIDQSDFSQVMGSLYIDLTPKDFNRLTADIMDRYYHDPERRSTIKTLLTIVDFHLREEFAERELENIFWSAGNGALNGFFLVIVANMLHRLSKVGVTKTFFDRLGQLFSLRIHRPFSKTAKKKQQSLKKTTELVRWEKNSFRNTKQWINNHKHKKWLQYSVGVSAGAGLGAGWYYWNNNLKEFRLSPSKALKNMHLLMLAEAAYTSCLLYHKKDQLTSQNIPSYLTLAETHLRNIEDITTINFRYHINSKRWIDLYPLPKEFVFNENSCHFPKGTKVLPELIQQQLMEFSTDLKNMIN